MNAQTSLEDIIMRIKAEKPFLIGICGVPGAGKSYFANKIKEQLGGKTVIIPMDGFHKYRKDLDQNGIKYRGAPFTFNLEAFAGKVQQLKSRKDFPIYFPSFSHALKDPVENTIAIYEDAEAVIIEGLYIFSSSLPALQFDMKIFITVDIQNSLQKVAQRHLKCGIEPSIERARQRAFENDKNNGEYVLQNSNLQNCLYLRNNY